MINMDLFVSKYVTKRKESMFLKDMEDNRDTLIEKIEGKTALVIGGAGSIGSEFIKVLLRYKPSALVVVDINENALTELTRDLRSTKGMYIPADYKLYAMDYYSAEFEKMFRKRNGFNIVANFSAHKHVRSEKDIYSIEALINNNVIHLIKLLDLLAEYPPEEYFCVSTDKAANPVNIMGASKRIMEELIFSYSTFFPVKTARFANVAFSNGSLPEGFLKRLEKRQPLSAPSDVTRYFVSKEESGHICLLACILGKNREIFFPKLSEAQMMTFGEIAEAPLSENGYRQQKFSDAAEAVCAMEAINNGGIDYPVYYSGSDTSGEKLYEEFITEDEKVDIGRFEALGVIVGKEKKSIEEVEEFIAKLEKSFESEIVSKEEIIDRIKSFIPEFNHIETNRTLDEKM